MSHTGSLSAIVAIEGHHVLQYALARRNAVGLNLCTSGWLNVCQQDAQSTKVEGNPLMTGENPAHVGNSFIETN